VKVTLTLALALVALLAPATAGAAERQARIYGGAEVADIAEVPFQAALVLNPYQASVGQFCGGSIRDATHVITAAHCMYDNPYTQPGQAIDPAALDVLVGTADLADESAPAQRVGVIAVSFEPRYGSSSLFAYDAAVLTLVTPLDLTSGPARAATRVAPTEWSATPPGTLLWVSGWGKIDSGEYPNVLHEAQVPLRDDTSCDTAYGGAIDGPIMVCAGDAVHDSCFGDSGGPLSVDVDGPPRAPSDLRLAGIVSFGPSDCADPVRPGVYTEIDGPVRAFVEAATPTPAPRSASSPAIAGTARVGEMLTCAPGAWSQSPVYSYRFDRGSTMVRGPSSDASYTVQPSDLGAQLRCEVTATNPGGYGIAASGPSAPVEAQAQPPEPTPLPLAAPPQPAPAPAPAAAPATDRVAPVARIAKLSCSRTRCTLDARVTDAGFSSGVRRVEVKLVSKYRTRCRRGKKRVACTRIRARSMRAASLATGGFRVRVTGLPAGRHTFTLRAVDVAGNRQAIPARRTVRTSGRR
jgi:secreted trypsin-like serine protease